MERLSKSTFKLRSGNKPSPMELSGLESPMKKDEEKKKMPMFGPLTPFAPPTHSLKYHLDVAKKTIKGLYNIHKQRSKHGVIPTSKKQVKGIIKSFKQGFEK